MILRKRALALWCLVWVTAVMAEDDTPPGLISKDSDQDLLAEPSNSVLQAQSREASLSNSYGEPLPADAYGPPRDIPNNVPDLGPPVYGVPNLALNSIVFPSNIGPPSGAYGPPSPISLHSVSYEGPPPPIKPHYGPPKPIYGPPKHLYGPPKKNYGPPKQSLPKPSYGAPFKSYGPPKSPKLIYGPPKPIYGPPKPIYGPPKLHHSINLPPIQNIHLPEISQVGLQHNFGQNLPAPIYGTPLPTLPLNLQPNFPIPSDSYGPPGHQLGPVGPNEQQIVLHELENNLGGHYGPPQPDPNPRPPHPGIPAPPTPPHVLYDGWKPIPGVSKPFGQHVEHHQHHQSLDQYGPPPPQPHQSLNQYGPPPQSHQSLDQYGPPPPPPDHGPEGHSLPNIAPPPLFSGAQISSGYAQVHQDALANIDLNAIVGGDSNHIDQSKTVFEAHYTEPSSNPQADLAFIQSSISGFEKPSDSYGSPPLDSFSSSGSYPSSIRQHGAKGLVSPSGIYGVPPGSQYGAPPRPPPSNLPIPYGTFSGAIGGHSLHTGGSLPKHPIKFRESVPEGLLQHIGATVNHKDTFGIDNVGSGPKYIPPPIREVKDTNQYTGNHGVSVSIEPTNLYSLPHSGNGANFQQPLQQPSNLYGSPIDSYAAPLLTVSDHSASGSNVNAVTATLDGTILANLSNLDAAEILKHCPYHEAILKAAKLGEKIPSDLVSKYVASLTSLGSKLSKHKDRSETNYLSFKNKDLSTASQNLIETVIPIDNANESDKSEKSGGQKGKSITIDSGKQSVYRDSNRIQDVSEQIQKTSEKIKNLSEEAKQLQQKIVTTNQNINQVNGQIFQVGSTNNHEIPVKGQLGTYTLQFQSSDDGKKGKHSKPSIPHEQLLSEGLLQSILQAIEQPQTQQLPKQHSNHNVNFRQPSTMDLTNIDVGGLLLPPGYEPVDRSKTEVKAPPNNPPHNSADQEGQSSHNIQQILSAETYRHRGDIPYTECDMKADNSIRHTIVVPAPTIENEAQVDEIDDNDVAIYFNDKNKDKSVDESNDRSSDPVTEISVATSISEEEEESRNAQQYGGKGQKEFGEKLNKKL